MKNNWTAAFEKMEAKATELQASGIVAIAEKEESGKIKMELKALGDREYDGWGNFYAIACCKIMQMHRTGKDSGQPTNLAGEFDFPGGATKGNFYVAFSGSTGEVDFEIAKAGLEELLSE